MQIYLSAFILLLGIIKCWTKNVTELIVLSAPSVNNEYYADRFLDIIKFHINYAKIIMQNNEVIVIADWSTAPFLTGGRPDLINDTLPMDKVLLYNVEDIWIRDFGFIVQRKPVMLKYLPAYQKEEESERVQDQFISLMRNIGVSIKESDESREVVEKSLSSNEKSEETHANLPADQESYNSSVVKFYPDLIVDGGNIVDNMVDTAILTNRVMDDNKNITDIKEMKWMLKNALGYDRIVIISQIGSIQQDTTGHSDGLLSFIDTNVVAFGQLEDDKQKVMVSELKEQLGDSFKLVELPSYWVNESDYHNFTSSCGTHANTLATRDILYVPVYGWDPESQAVGYTEENDNEVLAIIRNNTRKQVVTIPVPHKVCILGGATRCLSIQLEGPIADRLIQAAKESAILQKVQNIINLLT